VAVTVRHAGADEVCHCGQPARLVFVTEGSGLVPYCGGDSYLGDVDLCREASSETSS
jgi:hypothetical protein